MAKKSKHELKEFEPCTLFNSWHNKSDGYFRAVCSCGWKSTESKNQTVLAKLFEVHVNQQ